MDLLAVSLAEAWSEYIWPITLFVMGLGVVVFFHELGHFLAAKWAGIRVEVFSVGMGPRLFGLRGKETDYRISAVPIGGYIKMTGQEDIAPLKEGDADPRSFANKSVGARFVVIAAGVVMNVVFAALAYVVIGLVGIRFEAPVIGHAKAGYPAAKAVITWDDGAETVGIAPGDRVLTINGKRMEDFRQLRYTAVLAGRDKTFEFVLSRTDADGAERIGRATLGVEFGPELPGGTSLMFGVAPAKDLAFSGSKDMILPDDGIVAGDRVIAIDGEPVRHSWQVGEIEKSLTGEPVTVTVRRAADEQTYTVDFLPVPIVAEHLVFLADDERLRTTDINWDYSDRKNPKAVYTLTDGTERIVAHEDISEVVLDVLGLQPRLTVEAVAKGSPADDAGLKPGDIVIGYAGRGPPTLVQLLDLNKEFVGQDTQIIVARGDEAPMSLDIRPKSKGGAALVGIKPSIDQQHLIVARVRAGSPAAEAEMHSGDVITHVNDGSVSTWTELIDALAGARQADQAVTLSAKRGAHGLTVELGKLTGEQFDRSDYEFVLFAGPRRFKPLRELVKRGNPLSAIAWGVDQTLDKLALGYRQFPSLFKGNVSVTEVQGPIGIGTIAVRTARLGLVEFVDLMALISVILAVVNFLPFPVVDGGHAVFLIIEKVRGRPLSVRVMNVVQLTGLILLLGVFIAVTWQDIARLLSDLW